MTPRRQCVTGALVAAGILLGALQVQVLRVIDGDTMEVCCLARKREKVRYVGVNTKGVEAYGQRRPTAGWWPARPCTWSSTCSNEIATGGSSPTCTLTTGPS